MSDPQNPLPPGEDPALLNQDDERTAWLEILEAEEGEPVPEPVAVAIGKKARKAREDAHKATMDPRIVPADSCFVDWLALLSIAETPVSYQLLVGIAAFGAAMRRTVYVNQVNWHVYPNVSILLVGPSGIGKDTAINEAVKFLETTGLPKVYGRTMEAMLEQLVELGDPAAAYIPAPEITSFLGSKDYQGGMMNELTDLLSTKATHDVATKTNMRQAKQTGKAPVISRPTVSLFAGSTEEWLHKSMPEGSLEGGWWPRFLITYEEYGSKFVPLLSNLPKDQLVAAEAAKWRFYEAANAQIQKYIGYIARGKEITILSDARDFYCNWYINRHKYFSKTVRPYAERSRDQILRIALIMALSRGNGYIDLIDMQFADRLMMFIAKRIDKAVQPPSIISRIAKAIMPLLPCTSKAIVIALSRQHDVTLIDKAEKLLLTRGEIELNRKTGMYERLAGK